MLTRFIIWILKVGFELARCHNLIFEIIPEELAAPGQVEGFSSVVFLGGFVVVEPVGVLGPGGDVDFDAKLVRDLLRIVGPGFKNEARHWLEQCIES